MASVLCANSDDIEKTEHGTSAEVGMLQPAAPAVGLGTEERHSGIFPLKDTWMVLDEVT